MLLEAQRQHQERVSLRAALERVERAGKLDHCPHLRELLESVR